MAEKKASASAADAFWSSRLAGLLSFVKRISWSRCWGFISKDWKNDCPFFGYSANSGPVAVELSLNGFKLFVGVFAIAQVNGVIFCNLFNGLLGVLAT